MSNIVAWHANPSADGSAYYRMIVPIEALAGQQNPHDFSFVASIRDGDFAWADVVLAQRIASIELATEWLRRSQENAARLVYDVDDDLFSVPEDSPAFETYVGHSRIAMEWAMGAAHHLIASTDVLARKMRRYNDDVRVAPNCVPDYLIELGRELERGKLEEWRQNSAESHDRWPIVGWAGSATHAGDMATSAKGLAYLPSTFPARWHSIGGHKLPIESPHYRHTPWLRTVPAYYNRIDFDIALIPLADTEFNESKSDIKAREMAAMGIPVVCADHPVYRRTVLHGVTGFLYSSAEEMTEYLHQLVFDHRLRVTMGSNARAMAKNQFVISKNLATWQAAIIRKES